MTRANRMASAAIAAVLVLGLTPGLAAAAQAPAPQVKSGDPAFDKPFLSEINKYRARHSSDPVTVNPDLDALAQDYAVWALENGIKGEYSPAARYGRTLASDKSTNGYPGMKNVPSRWYAESRNYNYDDPANSPGRVSDFTQMVWKSSKSVGIGKACGKKQRFYACTVVALWDPRGNIYYGGEDSMKFFRENVTRPIS
ncbi:hypothetical protein CFP71_28425 [Amycolatopsis thailandensis]|uniref:SCP domain-containing protein n=1 Tax=Amycolatopsis thailandensis TaxID=589330 RepID=A0A229RUN8_9PSEU|nr:CAP family protein [Amycolatopsis thailandensis]OXM50356.1 hypothetical protein CFP71_28425 [Amycolatopsis thailandensis]